MYLTYLSAPPNDPNFIWATRSKEPVTVPSVLTPVDEAKANLSLRASLWATKSKTGEMTSDERERFLGKCEKSDHPACRITRELRVPPPRLWLAVSRKATKLVTTVNAGTQSAYWGI